jgi:hypothetical protein
VEVEVEVCELGEIPRVPSLKCRNNKQDPILSVCVEKTTNRLTPHEKRGAGSNVETVREEKEKSKREQTIETKKFNPES